MHRNYLRTLDNAAELAATKAVRLMEGMLHHAEETNRSVAPLIQQPCKASFLALRKQVTLMPFVRSTSLINHKEVYCNSLLGDVQWEDDAASYRDSFLRLLPGNQVRAHHPVLALRSESQDGATLSTIAEDHAGLECARLGGGAAPRRQCLAG